MKSLISIYFIQIIVALFTAGLLVYFPFFVGQFALISFVAYLSLSSLLNWIFKKRGIPNIYTFGIHLLSFLFAYSFFAYLVYGIVTMSHFGY
jgi:hypothetical protein